MTDWIRITSECDGHTSASAESERVFRFQVGARLPLLRSDDRHFYKVAHGGLPVFVPRPCAVLIDDRIPQDPAATIVLPPVPAPPAPAPGVFEGRQSERGRRGWFFTLIRITFFCIGLVLAGVGVGLVIAGLVFLSTDADGDRALSFLIGGGIALGLGLALVRATFRPLLQVALAFTGVALTIGGVELLLFAIPLSRMAERGRDPGEAATAMAASGGVLLTLGIGLCVIVLARWLRNPESRARWPDVVRWAAVIYGGLLALGVAAVPAAISVSAPGEEFQPTVLDAGLVGAMIPLSLIPGAILGYHGLTMLNRREEGPFRFVAAGALFALFVLAIALGAVVTIVEEPIVWLMSGTHAAAALLPALALIALASRGGLWRTAPVAGLTHRQLWVALAVGIAAVTFVAALIDGFVAQALALGLLAADGAFDGLRSFGDVQNVVADADLYLSRGREAVLLIILVVLIAPIMEEGFKALGVAVMLPRAPSPAVALTLGVAVGAGFGVTEASVYGLGGLDPESPIAWWSLMLLRGGATTMHALNTGVVGLALYYDRAEGRFRRAIALYLVAVASHGLWNGLAVLAGSRVIFTFEGLTDAVLSWVVFATMTALGLALLSAFYIVARRAYRASLKVGAEAAGLQKESASTGLSG